MATTGAISICTILMFGIVHNSPVEMRYTSNSDQPRVDCFSPELTNEELEVFAKIRPCSEKKDREFWQQACHCAVKSLPESECPKCRSRRNTESVLPRINNDNLAVSPISGIKLKTVDEQELVNKKLRMFQHTNNTSSISNSVNFIRFGK